MIYIVCLEFPQFPYTLALLLRIYGSIFFPLPLRYREVYGRERMVNLYVRGDRQRGAGLISRATSFQPRIYLYTYFFYHHHNTYFSLMSNCSSLEIPQ